MAKRRSHGEGGLYRRASDGRWVGSLPAAAAPDHKKRVVYGRTKAEALAKLDALKQHARGGTLPPVSRLTVGDLLTEFLASVRISGRSPATVEIYERAVRLRLHPHLGRIRLTELRAHHLTRLYHRLLTEPAERRLRRGSGRATLHPTTVAIVHRTLHLALALAVRWRYVTQNVADLIDAPPAQPDEAPVVTEAQLLAFLAHAAAVDDPLLAAWYLAADTGARRAELVALRWDDLRLNGPAPAAGSRPSVTIRHMLANTRVGPPLLTDPKTPRSRRTLTISPTTANALVAHRQRQEQQRAADPRWHDYGLVFPTRHGRACPPSLLYERFKRAARGAGLPAAVRLHSLRHAMATLALAHGASLDAVSRRLGHANTTVTLGVYNHVLRSSEEYAADVLAGILAPPSPPSTPAADPAADPAPPVDLAAQRSRRRDRCAGDR